MKKIFKTLIILLIGLVVLQSCKKEAMFDSTDDLYNNITAIKNLSKQRNAFRTLSAEEKANLWKAKYRHLKYMGNFNRDQLTYIDNLINLIDKNLFIKSSKKHKITNTVIMDELIKEGKLLFDSKTLFSLLFDLNNDDFLLINSDLMQNKKNQQRVCNCARGSRYTCGRLTSIGYISVGIEYGECSGTKCVMTDGGCGGFWSQDCNGDKCSY